MRFGASTFIWESPFDADSLYLIGKVKQLGFDLIEICIEDPATIDTDAIRDALNHHGVEALVCGAFGPNRDMSAEDDAVRADAARYLRTCIDIAARLGSPTVSGPMYAGVGNTQMRDAAGRRAQRQRSGMSAQGEPVRSRQERPFSALEQPSTASVSDTARQ